MIAIQQHQVTKKSSTSRTKIFKIVLGAKVRSKTGCLNCKKRKKKCPEDGLCCTACKTRGQECVWPTCKTLTDKNTVLQRVPPQNKSSTRITRSLNEEDIQEAMDDIGHANINAFFPKEILNIVQ